MQSQHRSTHLLRVMHGDAAVHTLVDAIVCQSGAATALETRRVASIMGVQEPGRRSGWRCWLPCCHESRQLAHRCLQMQVPRDPTKFFVDCCCCWLRLLSYRNPP
eukprot:COSAG01_NODE_46790_length_396_cov_534.377104_1_plen_104_part_01